MMLEYFNKLNNDKSHFNNSNDICTPMECVKEMVDKIPEEFWKNDNIKILDPCCGNGNFPAYISTKTKLKNIYFNEINSKRVDNLKKYFGENINLTQKDFLAENFDNDYDLIVANPPFALFTNGKRTAKNHNVSKLFIKKSLELLKNGGYLLYIVPDNFMSLADSNDTFKLLSQYDLLYINIHGAKRYFPTIGSSFVYFLLRKTNIDVETVVDNFYGKRNTSKVKIKNQNFLPLFYTKEVQSIFNKTILNNNEKLKVETSSYLHAYTKKQFISNIKDEKHPYKLIHTKIQTKWSSIPHKFQDGYKCFICLTSYFDTFVDNCGMTQSIGFVKTDSKDEAERLAATLKHPLYVFLNNVCRYGNFNNIRILQNFPYPKTNEPYTEFNITKEEQSFINNYLS